MDRLHSLRHPFDSHLSRIAGVAIGLALLWYGSSQISVAGLVVMLVGLVATVSAAAPPRLSLQPSASPLIRTTDVVPPSRLARQLAESHPSDLLAA